MNVANILARKGTAVVTIRPSATVAQAVAQLRRHRIGALVVTDQGGALLGMISERDILHGLAGRGPVLLELSVAEVMSRAVVTCRPDDSLRTVMLEMTQRRIRHLPVLAEGRIKGIISIGDVVKHRLDELESETTILRAAYIASH